MKNVIKFFLSALLVVVFVSFIASCRNTQNKEYDSNYSSVNTMTSITQSQAISYAENSSEVKHKIARLYDLKFYYIDWGTTTAVAQPFGGWQVVIKGTISGFTDDYKTNAVYSKKFTAEVTVYSSGSVGSVRVSKS